MEAILLGGSTARWAQSVLFLQFGLVLLVAPPQKTLSRTANWLLMSILACAACAFLPNGLLPAPHWKAKLGPQFTTILPSTISPQPWLSAEAFLLLCFATGWFYWVATSDVSRQARILTIQVYAFATILLSFLCLYFHYSGHPPSFWSPLNNFGPFPNRNQTGNVLGIGALLTAICGIEAARNRQITACLFFAGLAVIAYGLSLNTSRAGILIPVVGTALWMVGLFSAERSWKPLALGLSALILATGLFFVIGGALTNRFSVAGTISLASIFGYRWFVFIDAVGLGCESPIIGTGIGTFEPLFALDQRASVIPSVRVIHPESDWIWLWVEMGSLGFLALVVTIGYFLKLQFPVVRKHGWRWKMGAMAAIAVFILHGFVDPSGHRIGSLLPALLFGGLLVRPVAKAGRLTTFTFRTLGLAFVLIGAAWLADHFGKIILPGSEAVLRAKQEVRRFSAAEDPQAAVEAASVGLKSGPLDWQLYFERALAEVDCDQLLPALADFKRARMLQPFRSELSVNEGAVWADRRPTFALLAWEEALRGTSPEIPKRFVGMIEFCRSNPTMLAGLRGFALRDSRLLTVWLDRASAKDFTADLREYQRGDPDLITLNTDQLRKLFEIWARHDDEGSLTAAMQMRPRWMAIGWTWLAQDLAAKGDAEAAYHLAKQFVSLPTLPILDNHDSLQELRRRYFADRSNPAVVYSLAVAENESGNPGNALHLIKTFEERPSFPKYFSYLEGEYAAHIGDWSTAWASMQRYLASP